MAGPPEPVAPGETSGLVPAALSEPTSEMLAVSSNQTWLGALFSSSNVSVDSLIVIMIASAIAFWILCGYQIVMGHEVTSPMTLGTGFAAMLAAFGGTQVFRGRFGPGSPGG